MKAKKARKRLVEVDGLLADVIEKYRVDGNGVHELLDSARKSVASAMTSLDQPAVKTSPKAAATPGQRRSPNRKRLSAAAKKRWADAGSKGVSSLSSRTLHQTA
jgi:hypothetical protein